MNERGKEMKKLLAITLVLIMMLSLVACGGGGSDEEKDRLAQIKERGYIELATEPYFPPCEFIDPTKEGDEMYVGADIELAKYIADKIGVELKIVPLEFSAVLVGTLDGKYDMAISAIAYSKERAENYNVSDGYWFSEGDELDGTGFIMRAEDAGKYESIEDLKDAVVILQSGSLQESIFNEQVSEYKELKYMASATDCYLAVSEGMADVAIGEKGSATLYADANGGLVVSKFAFETDPMQDAIVVLAEKEGTDSLMAVINECIAELIAEDTINGWFEEYRAYARSLGLE